MPNIYDPEAREQWLREVVAKRQAEAVRALRELGESAEAGVTGKSSDDPVACLHNARYRVQALYGAVLDRRTARRRGRRVF